MKKFFIIYILSLMFFKPTFGGDLVGSGELKLSNGVINSWMRYITGDGKSINKPNDFFVTTDGEYSSYWYCPHGQCQPTKKRNAIKQCEARFERECRHFARRRNVVWKNGINTGKLKTSNFNSKMTRTEVIAKFTTLGFIGDGTSSSTTTPKITKKKKEVNITPKITKKKESNMSSGVVENLEKLKSLLDEGILTEEEFSAAKKKLLN